MSTAIERVMQERGDLDIPHEPFMYHYYLGSGRDFPGFAPVPGHPTDYAGIREMIRARSAKGPVFFKDMAYYVAEELAGDLGFAREMTHVFLVRDPVESVLSYAKKQADFTCEEVGVEGQWRLYQTLVAAGCDPLVVRSEAIRENPAREMARIWAHQGLPDAPQALSWEAGVPESWAHVAHWHPEVTSSGGIKPPEAGRDLAAELAALGAPYTEYVAHHRPFYERLISQK